MERQDIELIEKYGTEDQQLSRLYKEHIDFERRLERFNNKPYLSPEEEFERKTLQKKKLMGRDRIEIILSKYRSMDRLS